MNQQNHHRPGPVADSYPPLSTPSEPQRCIGARSRQTHGFTLVELLVVILIIIVLAALTFSVTQSVKRAALKATDMSNLRSLASAAMSAGTENAGKLPSLHAKSNFPYYLRDRDYLESVGITKEICYSVKGAESGGAPTYQWWYGFGNDVPIHYVYFANDPLPGNSPWFMGGSPQVPDKKEYRGTTPYDEIIKDKTKAFAARIGDDCWYPVLWAGICRNRSGGDQLSAFTKDGIALGLNVMYLDGHAEWVDGKKLKARYKNGSYSVFW